MATKTAKAPIRWDSVPWGSMSDSALAKMLGVAQSTVTRSRNRLGIAPIQHHPLFGVKYRKRLDLKVSFYKEQGWSVTIILPPNLKDYDTGTAPIFRERGRCGGCHRKFGSRDGPHGGKVRRATSMLCDPCWRKQS